MTVTVMDSIELPELEWISQLGAGDVKNARLLQRQASLLLHISRSKRHELTYEFPVHGGDVGRESYKLEGFSLVRDSQGRLRRNPCEQLNVVLEEHQTDIRSFLEKAKWLFRVFQAGDFLTAYQPEESERSYELALRDYLGIVHEQNSTFNAHDVELQSSVEEIQVLHGILSADWCEVFSLADAGLEMKPASLNWADVVVQGISGNMEFIRDSLETPDGLPEGCPSNIFLGAFLQKLELHQEAINAFRFGLPRFLRRKDGHACHFIGKSYLLLGEGEAAVPWLLRSLKLDRRDLRSVLRNLNLLMDSGNFKAAFTEMKIEFDRNPGHYGIGLNLANLYLWVGEYERVREVCSGLEAPEGETGVRTMLAALEVLEGNYLAALPLFEDLINEGAREGEIYCWYSEVCLRLELHDKIPRALERARAKEQSVVNIVYHRYYEWLDGVMTHSREFTELLSVLGLSDEADAAGEDPAKVLSLLDATLERFKGNRGAIATWIVPRASGTPHEKIESLRRIRLDEALPFIGSRTACSDALRKLQSHSFEEVEQDLDGLLGRFPESPHPYFYRGELFLWRGELDKAYEDFHQGHSRLMTRWSFVGKAAVNILREEYEEAMVEIEKLRERFDPLAAATTYVYQGEMYRRVGKLEEAERLLGEAVDAKPGRLAAWLNLALIYERTDREEKARELFDRYLCKYPRLFWDALENPKTQWPPVYEDMESLYEQVFTMMRGNRSSHMISYFDRQGRFRVLQDVDYWVDFSRKNAHNIGAALAIRLTEKTLGN